MGHERGQAGPGGHFGTLGLFLWKFLLVGELYVSFQGQDMRGGSFG